MAILVTGGLGYIGSHTCLALAEAGHALVIVDNLCNSRRVVFDRLRELAPRGAFVFHEADLRDPTGLGRAFGFQRIDAVIHFAGLKAVGESTEKPLLYYDNNVRGTLSLLEALAATRVRKFVFSSSATVYGNAERMPVDETAPTAPTNPYGRTKLMVEQILEDVAAADHTWKLVNLRYFNPVGAHESARIGEDPAGVPNNLMPYVCQVAAGRREKLSVFGSDYPTGDGSGVRDYIHVLDLAEGHAAALDALDRAANGTTMTVNLGTGRGYSVLEMVRAFERVNGVAVRYQVVGRRPGDIATCYADPTRARELLGWKAKRGLDEMCRDAWRWQRDNPRGYGA